VTYGFAAGQTPSQAIVTLLQLRGDNLISQDTVRRQLPFDIDPEEEQVSLDAQRMEDALLQGLMAFTQQIGPMALQGQDPLPLVQGIAKAVELRRKGRPLAEAVTVALTPPEPEPEELEQQMLEEEAAMGGGMPGEEAMGGELPPRMNPDGMPVGVAPGQAGMAPGGMPDIQSMIATLRGEGAPRQEVSTLTKRPRG
jgi:hypothetical protein